MAIEPSSAQTQLGEIYKDIQVKYGEKPTQPRQIKKTLGKDDFLNMMVLQMKNQDPTNPFKAEQMATEIAQFTSVEQLQNINQNLNKMSRQNKPSEQMAMTNLIGKTVTMDRQRFPHTENENNYLSFHLPKNAKEVSVSIVNDLGEEIFKKELGNQKAGDVNFSWDGMMSNGMNAKSNNYQLKIDAKDDRQIPITINSVAQAKIIGVSFEGSEPAFLVGDSNRQEKITMKNIIKIEMDRDLSPTQKTPQVIQSSQNLQPSIPKVVENESAIVPVGNSNSNKNNFISFQKGVGSSNLDNEQTMMLEQLMKNDEKGFPNGLNSEENVGLSQ